MQNLRPTLPIIVKVIGMSGIFGVSMIISLSSDLLAFMTLHVYWFYMVAARIFNWQFTILYSLFNLFRGNYTSVTYIIRCMLLTGIR
jgi:phosphatidylinositol glycan class Q protein